MPRFLWAVILHLQVPTGELLTLELRDFLFRCNLGRNRTEFLKFIGFHVCGYLGFFPCVITQSHTQRIPAPDQRPSVRFPETWRILMHNKLQCLPLLQSHFPTHGSRRKYHPTLCIIKWSRFLKGGENCISYRARSFTLRCFQLASGIICMS